MKYLQLPLLSIVVLLSANTAFGAASTSTPPGIDTPAPPPASAGVGSSLVPAPSHAPPSSSASSAPSVAEIERDLKTNFRQAFEEAYGDRIFRQTPLGTPVPAVDKRMVRHDIQAGKSHIILRSPKFKITVAREIPRARAGLSINVASHLGTTLTHIDMYKKAFLGQCKKEPKGTFLGIGEGNAYLANEALKDHTDTYIFNEMNPMQLMGAACDLPQRSDIYLNDRIFATNLAFEPDLIHVAGCFHVFTYLSGAAILTGSQQVFEWLKPGGFFVVTGLSMYANPFTLFQGYLEQQLKEGKKEWPTEMDPKALAAELNAIIAHPELFPFDLPLVHPLNIQVLSPVFEKIGFKVVMASHFAIMELKLLEDELFKTNFKAEKQRLAASGLSSDSIDQAALRERIQAEILPGGKKDYKKSRVGFVLQKPVKPKDSEATPTAPEPVARAGEGKTEEKA